MRKKTVIQFWLDHSYKIKTQNKMLFSPKHHKPQSLVGLILMYSHIMLLINAIYEVYPATLANYLRVWYEIDQLWRSLTLENLTIDENKMFSAILYVYVHLFSLTGSVVVQNFKFWRSPLDSRVNSCDGHYWVTKTFIRYWIILTELDIKNGMLGLQKELVGGCL